MIRHIRTVESPPLIIGNRRLKPCSHDAGNIQTVNRELTFSTELQTSPR
ncbi:MAG: hypothetical protein KatS3mg113_0749 [Planctomycetaceae bacterium]|nr:MAG: hypothetical protein KatS3mg113_0749 [Planctomycetaceae bacterium]